MSSETTFPTVLNEESYILTYAWEIKLYDPENADISIIPRRVLAINKTCNYLEAFMPVLLLRLNVSKTDMFILKKNKKNILANVTVKSKKYIRANSSGSLSEVESKIEFSSTYEVIFSPSSFDERYREDDFSEDSPEKDSTGYNTNVLETNQVEMVVNFVDKTAINVSKTLFNTVLESATPGDMLQYIATSTDATKVLIDKPDNDTSYSQVIIPPCNFLSALNYVQSVYGAYENGLGVFYDNGVLTVLNRFASSHDVESGEKTVSHLYIGEGDTQLGSPIYSTNDSSESIYMGVMEVSPADREIVASELLGDNFISSSFRQGIDAVTFKNGVVDSKSAKPVAMVMKHNTDSHKYSGTKNVLDYDEMNNPYNMASTFNTQEAMSKPLTIIIDNVNFNDFKNNKYVHLHFKDSTKEQRLGGKYYVLHAVYALYPSGLIPTQSEMDNAVANGGSSANSLKCSVVISVSMKPSS